MGRKIKTVALTDVGRKRKINQDYVFATPDPLGNLENLVVVADGMGGHRAGDYASKCATRTLVEEAGRSTDTEPARILAKAIDVANRVIWAKAGEDDQLYGMGTTLVAASLWGDQLFVANVGDSRLYVITDRIRQVTRDHSVVAELVRAGGLDAAGARTHPDHNVITRAVGAEPMVRVDIFVEAWTPGQVALLCSDGLTNMLEDDEILGIFQRERPLGFSLEVIAGHLIEAANEKGGRDNIAVVMLEAQ